MPSRQSFESWSTSGLPIDSTAPKEVIDADLDTDSIETDCVATDAQGDCIETTTVKILDNLMPVTQTTTVARFSTESQFEAKALALVVMAVNDTC